MIAESISKYYLLDVYKATSACFAHLRQSLDYFDHFSSSLN